VITVYRRRGLPTSAARELGGATRRTLVLRVGLVLGAAALAALTLQASTSLGARPTSYFASGGGGVVVLDVSTSVEPRKYQRIQRVLRSLSETSTRLGLVMFSDVGYEMFPPGTRGDELRALMPFFEPPPQPAFDPTRRGRRFGPPLPLPRTFGLDSPWDTTFRGGTKISHGLAEARRVIDRDGVRPTVMLVSDLDDSALDTEELTQELIRYEAEGIELRVVPLFAFNEDRDLFERLVGEEAFVHNDELLRNSEIEERQTLVGSFPTTLVLAAAALLALLALNEHLLARVSWRRA
jgi:hypothetical protein